MNLQELLVCRAAVLPQWHLGLAWHSAAVILHVLSVCEATDVLAQELNGALP